jgi:hypothetical protein
MTSCPVLRSYTPTGRSAYLSPFWDAGAYDDILDAIRRQGFFDSMGSDLVPSNYDNGIFVTLGEQRTNYLFGAPKYFPVRTSSRKTRSHSHIYGSKGKAHRKHRAEIEQERWEAAQREKQRERQRISDALWLAEEQQRQRRFAIIAQNHRDKGTFEAQLRARDERHQRELRAIELKATGIVRNHPIEAQGSLTCSSCCQAEQKMLLPAPELGNRAGAFSHACSGCGLIYQLVSKQLAAEVAWLRGLCEMPIASPGIG